MSLQNAGLWVATALIAVIAVLGLSRPHQVAQIVGNSGSTFTNAVEFLGGVKYGNNVASTSLTTATVSAAEFAYWVNADTVILTPTGAAAAKTVTFPASSTVSSVLPEAGDTARTCFFNATTSAATPIIFAGGTGISISVASSSVTTLGSLRVDAGEVGCFTFVREAAMAASFDIEALYTAFK